jgi:hypothetical protein
MEVAAQEAIAVAAAIALAAAVIATGGLMSDASARVVIVKGDDIRHLWW